MKVLFLSRWYPYPPDNGAKIRIYNLIKQLALRHQVDLISYCESGITDEQKTAMSTVCQRVDTVVYVPFKPNGIRALVGLFNPLPRSVVDTFNQQMQDKINQAVLQEKYDLVIASQIDMAIYIRHLDGLPRVIEEIELSTLSEQADRAPDALTRLRTRIMWRKWERYINSMMKTVDGATVVSQKERERLMQLSAANHAEKPGCPVKIVPNGVDNAYQHLASSAAPKPDTLVFNGALTYDANFDAIFYFLDQIFPLIQADHPKVRLFVTGSLISVPLEKLPANDSVVFTGYVPDIRSMVAESWVNVVPLRIGGGTRLKILESLSLGTPVVATSKGAEGLNLTPGQDLLIADDPKDFAAAVLSLLKDAEKRSRFSRSGQLTVAEKYDWRKIGPDLCDFIELVVSGKNQDD
jgi:glycosyltransferase involved in cell wall biosynthesis